MKIEYITERKAAAFDAGWSQDVKVGDKEYHVVMQRGRSVIIPYKPRGKNKGFKWNGSVYEQRGARLWAGEVSKSTGVRSMLVAAGILPSKPMTKPQGE